MRGKKAKALRQMVGFNPTKHRTELEHGYWPSLRLGTCRLAKDHPRRAYRFAKARYSCLPLASALSRLRAGV